MYYWPSNRIPMRCADFLELYSDYRDGRLQDLATVLDIERHLRDCPRCARQDVAVRRGVDVLRAAPGLQPSAAFRAQLKERLTARGRHSDPTAARGRFIASLLVAAGVALLVIEGVTWVPETGGETLSPQVVANPGPPFVGFAEPDPGTTGEDPDEQEETALPGPAAVAP
jgi:anti-sigma factor RsiW